MDFELTSKINQSIYLFGGGVLVGKFTGPLTSLAATAGIIYYFYPQFYTYETFIALKKGAELLLQNTN